MNEARTRAWAVGLALSTLLGGGVTVGLSSTASAAGTLSVESVSVDVSAEVEPSAHTGWLTAGCTYEVTFAADPATPEEELLVKAESPDGYDWNYSGKLIDGREFEVLGSGRYLATVPCEYVKQGWGLRAVRYDFASYNEREASALFQEFEVPEASGGPMRMSFRTEQVGTEQALLTGGATAVSYVGDALPVGATVTSRVWTSAQSIWQASDLDANIHGTVAVVADAEGAMESFTLPAAQRNRWAWLSVRVVEEGKTARLLTAGPYLIASTQPAGWVKSYGTAKAAPVAGQRLSLVAPVLSTGGKKAAPVFSYTWKTGSKTLLTTTAPSYKVPASLRRKRLSVLVSSSKAGYTTRSKVVDLGVVR